MSTQSDDKQKSSPSQELFGFELRDLLRRGPAENVASALIALGIFMLMQPFSMFLFSWSFAVILVGTIGFVVVSHFPE